MLSVVLNNYRQLNAAKRGVITALLREKEEEKEKEEQEQEQEQDKEEEQEE